MFSFLSSLALAALLLSASSVLAKLYTDPSELPSTEYDFIVIGAGTAGNVVARRLADSSDQKFKVLILEAGIQDDNPIIPVPYLPPNLLTNTSLYWNYATTPQTALNSRILGYQRGRVLGGSSSVNFLIYTVGSKDDFDRIARVTGDPGWGWDSILSFVKKAEQFTQPQDHHNITGEYDPLAHGFGGPLRTSLPNFPMDTDSRVLNVTETTPVQFPFNLDANSGDTIGIGWAQSTSGGGRRSSSSSAYLQPVVDNPNVDVVINAQVTKLLDIASPVVRTASHKRALPDLRAVEFARDATTPRITVHATKEVILSAGAVNTPQLLLLSGVGDQDALSQLGIPVVLDSPGVGQNLQDHPLISSSWSVNSNNTFDDISRNATLAGELLQQWAETRTGVFSDIGANQIGWLRVPSLDGSPDDPSAGPTSSHFELLPANQFVSFIGPSPATGSYFTILNNVASPASRGSITLNSSNPFDFPVMDPAFLTNPLDVQVLLHALKTSQAFVSTPPFQGFIISPYGDLANAKTDDDLIKYIRNQATTFWHTSGTAKMGKADDPSSVVDPQLFVKGLAKSLRVVDASVFPYIPAAHPQAAIYAIAERAASLILERWT